jgi:integrase
MASRFNELSDVNCRHANSAGKPVKKINDGDGLYLWVTSEGSKYWRFRYRFNSKEKCLAFGVYPKVSLKEARDKRDAARKLLSENIDPSVQKKIEKLRSRLDSANTFKSVAIEWLSKKSHVWSDKHVSDVKRRLEVNLFPQIGDLPINNIEAPELLAAIRQIEKRGALDLSHRVLQVAGQVIRYGIAIGKCKRDPTADLRGALATHKKKNQAAIKPEKFPTLLKDIENYESVGGERQTTLALKMVAYTFVRTNELIGARWEEFDLDAKLWVIPAERMKMKAEHLVPLADQALEILTELKVISGNGDYVLQGRSRFKPVSNNTMLFALYRLGYKGKMTGHGFRSLASTILNESEFNRDVIERQLAHHERNEVRGAYNRAEYLPARRKMMQWWADYLDVLRKSENTPL